MTIVNERIICGLRCLEPEWRGGEDRQVILFIHGAGGTAEVWRPLLGLFRELHPVAVDMPGHGGSSGPSLGSIDEAADLIDKLREELGQSRIGVFGHSLGGAVAQLYAHRHADRCAAIIVASSGTRFTADPARTARVRSDWRSCVEEFVRGQISPRASEQAREAARAMIEARDPEVFADDLVTCRTWDSRPWLSSIRVPCLVIVGREDPMTPLEKSLEIYEMIPHAQLEVIGPAGHAPFLEQPVRYAAAIDAFVAQLGASTN